MKTFKTTVNNNNIYRRYVEVIDTLTRLSEREKDILAILLKIQHEWEGDKINIINRKSRKEIVKNTYVSKSNLSKYIKNLREKNAIIEGDYGLEINPYLFPDFNSENFIITYIFDRDE